MPAPWLILPNPRVQGDPPTCTSQPPLGHLHGHCLWLVGSLLSHQYIHLHCSLPPHILPLLQGVAEMMHIGWRLDGLVSNYCHCLIKFNICILNSVFIFAKLLFLEKIEMFWNHSIQNVLINLACNCTLYTSLNGLSTCPTLFRVRFINWHSFACFSVRIIRLCFCIWTWK